jgi:hypothetical protein
MKIMKNHEKEKNWYILKKCLNLKCNTKIYRWTVTFRPLSSSEVGVLQFESASETLVILEVESFHRNSTVLCCFKTDKRKEWSYARFTEPEYGSLDYTLFRSWPSLGPML